MRLFDRDGDYRDLLEIFAAAQRRISMRCFAYCLMPNHFHFVLRPFEDGDLSKFMWRFTTAHSKWWQRCHGSEGTGHVYQGRFKAIPVSIDEHFFRVCRYVERNPLRAGLVSRAEEWPWSSLFQREGQHRPIVLSEWPLPRPASWLELVHAEGREVSEIEEIRTAIRRSSPLGPEVWRKMVAERLKTQRSIRPLGRPKKGTMPGVIFFAP
jgi:putative transposase